MSVWPNSSNRGHALCGSEGALVSVSVNVEPRDLEEVLDVLARLDFPINPQIYHDAALIYHYRDGRDVVEPATLVEFPAYEARLGEIRKSLQAHGFAGSCVHVAEMLEDIHSGAAVEAAPPGAPYSSITQVRRLHGVMAAH